MSAIPLITADLELVLSTPEQAQAMIKAMSPEEHAQLSPEWLAGVKDAKTADPWLHGFSIVHRGTGETVGNCGFNAPPSGEGDVEIAYMVFPKYQGKGFATQAAQALCLFAMGQPLVKRVCAHTQPEPNASTRVLTKCGFTNIGEVDHPEDGRVWRWEKA